MKKLLLISFAVAAPIFAAGPCPTANGFGADATYLTIGGCNVVITFNANGSITTTVPNSNPYDGAEDTLVGIVNNSGSAISSVGLSSTTLALFGFDGDGACESLNGTQMGGVYESVANCAGVPFGGDPNDYEGPGVSFSGINAAKTSGTVNFSPAIAANGGTAWFSLEEPPSLNFVVTTAPEPGSLMLFGTILAALGFFWRRRCNA